MEKPGQTLSMNNDATVAANQIVPVDEDSLQRSDPSFIQNQIFIQRSPSVAKAQASALSHKLSVKSNRSFDTKGHAGETASANRSKVLEEADRGRERGDFDSSKTEAVDRCSLAKSSSDCSTKSVRSLHALGGYPLGSLRVHPPSPTRNLTKDTHDCLKSGDVIIISSVTAGSLLGYDTRAFVVKKDEKFDGIKDVPAGAHFIWGGSDAASLRNGFWIMSAKRTFEEFGEVHVRRWDNYAEVIEEEISVAELKIQKDGLPDIFEKLQQYDISSSTSTNPAVSLASTTDDVQNIWYHLTSSIKGALLSKVTGHGWNHWQVSSTHDYKSAAKHGSSPTDDPMSFEKDEVLNFVFPRDMRTFNSTSIGRDRTEQVLDTSAHVMAVISGYCSYEDSDEIIGELQFCYVTGMLLGNIACMEQWAHIVKVVFKAFQLALDNSTFFRKFIGAVHAQFIYDEEGLDGSILDHEPSLSDDIRMILTIFKSRLNELLLARKGDLTPGQSEVGKAFEELESWLWKWNWDLRGNYVRSGKIQLEDGEIVDAELKDFEAEDERGEYAPAIVELDEDGREKDRYSL